LQIRAGSREGSRSRATDRQSTQPVGAPALLIRADLELTTWQQAAELAHAILDGFGYLAGADRA
jgi:hypothetical protein